MTTRSLLLSAPRIARKADAREVAYGVFGVLPSGVKALALALSVSAHLALALGFAGGALRRASTRAPTLRDEVVEIAAIDFGLPDAALRASSAGNVIPAPHHSHPYPVPANHDLTPHDPALHHPEPTPSADAAALVAAEAVSAPPSPITPRFVLNVGSAVHGPATFAPASDAVRSAGSHPVEEPVPEAAVDTAASLLTGNAASYPREAEAAGIEASVPLEIVVDRTGAVIDARALTRVGYGLDEAAVRGIRAYRFSPARRAGKPLAVRMRWLMRFQLR